MALRERSTVNLCFSLACPTGTLLFWLGATQLETASGLVIGSGLAAAGLWCRLVFSFALRWRIFCLKFTSMITTVASLRSPCFWEFYSRSASKIFLVISTAGITIVTTVLMYILRWTALLWISRFGVSPGFCTENRG